MKYKFFLGLGLLPFLLIMMMMINGPMATGSLLALGSPMATDSPKPADSPAAEFDYLSYDQALKKAAEEDKMIMIFFWTDWCAYCTKIRKEVFEKPDVQEAFNKDFVAVSIDMEKDSGELAKKYQIKAFPTLTFLDSQGEFVGFWPGFADKDTFFEIMKRVQVEKDS